jgi:hypothetical protein
MSNFLNSILRIRSIKCGFYNESNSISFLDIIIFVEKNFQTFPPFLLFSHKLLELVGALFCMRFVTIKPITRIFYI